ncbi:hypothetical protein BX600DRAFT_4558 [Xylariales sp. PMI_506]|nr:hypothetical protein BX600DRAFT_4558 [Xylariales sp. PMI_506]
MEKIGLRFSPIASGSSVQATRSTQPALCVRNSGNNGKKAGGAIIIEVCKDNLTNEKNRVSASRVLGRTPCFIQLKGAPSILAPAFAVVPSHQLVYRGVSCETRIILVQPCWSTFTGCNMLTNCQTSHGLRNCNKSTIALYVLWVDLEDDKVCLVPANRRNGCSL